MTNPTNREIRKADKWGLGTYGAPRGSRRHKGADFICIPDQNVLSPIAGRVIREARPYSTGYYSGVLIEGSRVSVKMFYLKLKDGIIGQWVEKGQIIGKAQNIAEKFPGMIPHIHLEITRCDPTLLMEVY